MVYDRRMAAKPGVKATRDAKRGASGAVKRPAAKAAPAAPRRVTRRPAAKAAPTARGRKPLAPEAPRAERSAVSAAAQPTVGDSWARIEAWFAARHPSVALNLRAPASAAQIAVAEKALRVKFPADFRASLAVHDGQDDHPGVWLLPYAQRLGSLASLTRCWKDDRALYDDKEMRARLDWLDDGQRVRQVHLHPQHIPIAGSKYWDYGRLLLDYAPGPAGAVGQVIARHDVDFVFVCRGFGELLARTARGLMDGSITTRAGGDALELVYLKRAGGKAIGPERYFAT